MASLKDVSAEQTGIGSSGSNISLLRSNNRAPRLPPGRNCIVLLVEIANAHSTDGKGIAHHQGVDGTGSRRQTERTGLLLDADVDDVIGLSRQIESSLPVKPITTRPLCLSSGSMVLNSPASPELEIMMTRSPLVIMPKSPCSASAGWTKRRASRSRPGSRQSSCRYGRTCRCR